MSGTLGIITNEIARYSVFGQLIDLLEVPEGTLKIWGRGVDVVKNRNEILDKAVGEWLCMIDDDQVFHADILMKLLARDKDVIAPLILERHFPYKPVAFRNINGERQSVLMNGLQEVDALGTGIFLMKRKVWETVGKFRYSGEVIKEDLDYCQRIKAAGFSIFCDFSLPAGHMTPFAVWPLANGKVGLRNHNKTHVVDRT
jgi:hypothetical protein